MAPASLRLVKTDSYNECLICKKPLGADSKEQGFMFCHEHRKCSKCEIDISAIEAKACLKKFLENLETDTNENPIDYSNIEVICINCYKIEQDPTRSIKQSELDYLNLIRLMIEPDIELSQTTNEKNAQIYSTRLLQNMDFERKTLFQKRIEAILELTQDTVRRDPSFRKEFLAEREKERFDNAKKEAATSSRPANKIAEDPEEMQLAAFVELRQLNPANRKENLKALRDRNKAVKGIMKTLSLSEKDAIEYLEKFRRSN